ncbi:MAG: ABC transporter ATP-binding protein [Oligosphaeraceae bacterium]|nr:ABC transporter ATP-binding protein [Oligosphaeraceae bacterium]
MDAAILSVQGLSLTLQGVQILHDISFQLERGACHTILGPNGAGKSSLLKCLNRIQRGYSGDIYIEGLNSRTLSQRQIAHHIAFVSQRHSSQVNYLVQEFLLLSRFARHGAWHRSDARDREALEFAVESTGIGAFLQRSLPSLSGGEQQKVYIAAALMQQSPILLLDEPGTFLDPRYQKEINALLLKLKKQQQLTLLQVTHDINAAAEVSDHLFLLKNGRLLQEGSPQQLINPETMQKLFDSQFSCLSKPDGNKIII